MPNPTSPPAPGPQGLVVQSLKSRLAGPFDLELAAGACAAVSGPSGSGKSLFLRMIADLDPNEGDVMLHGQQRAALAAPDWRRRAPYVAAESGWWRDTVAEHFQPQAHTPARALADRLGLAPDIFDGPVQRLSTGERQRLALIRALVLEPRLLLLDEPTGALDPDSVRRVEAVLVERLEQGLTLILVTHDPGQAERLGARRLEMRERRLHEVGA